MKKSLSVSLLLAAVLVIGSTSCTKRQLIEPDLPKEKVCADAAFIDRGEYALEYPPKDPVQFEMWQADIITQKYPSLLFSYDTLVECWNKYKDTE